jgi:hypothetical protein
MGHIPGGSRKMPPRKALFETCLVALFRLSAGKASVRLLRRFLLRVTDPADYSIGTHGNGFV